MKCPRCSGWTYGDPDPALPMEIACGACGWRRTYTLTELGEDPTKRHRPLRMRGADERVHT